MGIAEFSDPRLVSIYETVNPYEPGTQPDFYLRLAAEIRATTVVDLGCGTGLISREFARHGYRVIGVDPAAAMIEIARQRPEGDRVQWIVGEAGSVGTPSADLAIMSGHVAQFFITDDSWHSALVALRSALRPGGRLAFESRNPEAREWDTWTSEARWSVDDPVAGRVETWTEVDDVQGSVVSFTNHYLFGRTGDEVLSLAQLRFRSEDELTQSLAEAGFTIEHVYGNWDRRPATTTTSELIVVAARAAIEGI